ncbi:polyphosphoinositide phosphatase-like [Amphibalanus amphitrite]|uniref:polyphosphoinositide phosphatase-like n=1 Tax=Amphibalanus amphitrite TaxID=1232801 RepID=UPI001C913A20|nr:polyphosphoinositide phosphatase-like [Amphibalanus amphitrite]
MEERKASKPPENEKKSIKVATLVSPIQKVGIYETKARFFVIGSNTEQDRFRVLKVDRTEPRELHIVDDALEYSASEIRDIMRSLDEGNRLRAGGAHAQGLVRRLSAFGIVGFVRFTEGYYIIVVTQRRRLAVIGPHVIYKIEDTKMIYIPNQSKRLSPEEQRYVKLFQSVAMGSNFYFSYSYDLTHTLQYNAATPRLSPEDINAVFGADFVHTSTKGPLEETDFDYEVSAAPPSSLVAGADRTGARPPTVGVRAEPQRRFVWNNHLLEPAEHQMGWEWRIYITHGYIKQATLYLHGRHLFLTLMARRSSRYAGTRFLKRGASFKGDVANEVETEQIVHDACVSSLQHGMFSSHVQIRGSVPCHWYQDTSRIPKPPIQMELSDPCHITAGKHMNDLLARYGAPVFVVNLVKKREKRSHESLLHGAFSRSVAYLNQFIPPAFRLRYISFDMARANKLERESVMERLTEIANASLKETGIFLSQPPLNTSYRHTSPVAQGDAPGVGLQQHGIVRVNCVDCLDRTNTAQFTIGKAALAAQLFALGAIPSPRLEFDTDCMSILEDMFEDHGDLLALQYGGSQLVHRIRTYRKTANWGSQGNDIVQTMQRYYSNTVTDADKQNAINLFLGCFVPRPGRPALWELPNDYQLHHDPADRRPGRCRPTQWWDDRVMRHLPAAAIERDKRCSSVVRVAAGDGRTDLYREQYRPHELTSFPESFDFNVIHSVKDYMPSMFVDESPFAVRTRRQPLAPEGAAKTPPSSAQANGDSSLSEGSDSSEDSPVVAAAGAAPAVPPPRPPLTLATLLSTARDQYGIEQRPPQKQDLSVYRRHAGLGRLGCRGPLPRPEALRATSQRPVRFLQLSQLKMDSSREVAAPMTSRAAREVYQRAVSCQPPAVPEQCLTEYRRYVGCAV